jgi:hypothetical protein
MRPNLAQISSFVAIAKAGTVDVPKSNSVMMAPELVSAAGPIERLIADKAYDTNDLRSLLAKAKIEAVIPSVARRKPLIPYDREAYLA